MNVKDKTAIVTGGANGIGYTYVEQLLRHDAKCVAILDLLNSNGEKAVAKLEKEYGKGRVIFLHCDVTKPDQLTSSLETVFKKFGGLDILVNNAGIMDDTRWELEIELNVTALIRSTLLTMELMGKHNAGKGGTIINIASVAGLAAGNIVPVYMATKHAVVGFSRSMKDACGKAGIRILVLCPGPTDTELIQATPNKYLKVVDHKAAIEMLRSFYLQKPEHVAKAMIEMIEKGKNGEVYVSEDDQPLYGVDFPPYSSRKLPV